MLQKNDVVTAAITGYTSEGLGVARSEDGMAVFVRDAIAGEVAKIAIDHVGKSAAYGHIETLETVSPHRVARACPLGKRCGGCAFWHMDYEEELRLKAQRVRDAMTRIGGFDPGEVSIIGGQSCQGYRNKAQYPAARGKHGPVAGFYQARTHEVVPVERCLIQSEQADAVKDAVLGWMRRWSVQPYDERTHRGLVRHIYARTASTGQVLACVVGNGGAPARSDDLVERLKAAVPGLRTVVWSVNTRRGNTVLGPELHNLWGDGVIEETLCGLTFRLSARSFFQVNRAQAERLYETALELADLQKTDVALDLYCGTGTITLCMARHAGRVIGVEVVDAAIDDARENAARNEITNASFFCADAGEAAQRLADEGTKPDVILVDPPRKGLAPEVIDAMVRMAPRRIVYVSCDPATLARDAGLLTARGYAVKAVRAADLFPRCAHVETIVLLQRENS